MLASHLRGDSDGLPAPIVVRLVQSETEATARVEFVGDDAPGSVRELRAPTCGEVAAAAALVVALAIDTLHAAPPAAPALAAPAPIAVRPPAAGLPPRDVVRHPPKPRSVRLEMGGGGVAEHGVAPDPLFGGNAFFGVGDRSAAWNFRARIAYARSGVVASGDQQARFTLLVGGLDACAWPIVGGKRWALQPCAGVEVGRVESEGLDTTRYTSVRRYTIWGAGGPLLRVQGTFDELRVEGYGGPWIPFMGPRTFVFEGQAGDSVFHRVPWVGWLGGVNLVLGVD